MLSLVPEMRVLVDFDGTIVPGDVTDHIMASFAAPEWLELEAEFQAGRMGARQCMAAQVDLIRATPADIARAINEREIDPDFPAFVDASRARNMAVTIVSDGFGVSIATMLERYGLDLPYTANELTWLGAEMGGDRWQLDHPYRNPDCQTESGNCKCLMMGARPVRTVVIGDGRSDFCAAGRADFVLAKGKLAEHCRKSGIRHWEIGGFDEVVARFEAWVAEAHRVPVKAPLAPLKTLRAGSTVATSRTANAWTG